MWIKNFLNTIINKSPVTAERPSTAVGEVKFFNRRRGYGFIIPKDRDREVFVHVTQLKQPISRGDKVTFNIHRNDKGLEAHQVRRLES